VGATGQPLTPAIAWFDNRTTEQAAWWRAQAGQHRIYDITGLPLDRSYGANKLLWLREHAPAAYRQARRWLSIADFIELKLSGEAVTVPSLASRTMLYDQARRTWSGELLELAEIAPELLPAIVESGTTIGSVTDQASTESGLPAGCAVVSGGHDHLCSALALRGGTERPVNSAGTAEVVVAPTSRPLGGSPEPAAFIACYADVEPHGYVCSARVGLSGALVEWVRKELFGAADYDTVFEQLDGGGPSGLLCLPTFGRPAGPHFDPRTAVGTIVGLTLASRPPQIVHGLLEGVCFSLRANLDQIERVTGRDAETITVGGGAVQNPGWLQLKANITGKAIERGATAETTLLGAALLACSGGSHVRDLAREVWRVDQRFEPLDTLAATYDELYLAWAELGSAVAPAAGAAVRLQEQVPGAN
jgi:xylulokinase